ncbi:MAG: coiled coil domain-containing protein [Candidatus Loosdrechtia sp.]|uniref:coiled coil domain-containing protein n=1 Tax=Candidatus Loosdrechtia sp. TaxID=3101272 RepID=UPI003A66D577|nr:MAG: hypothetical protein QY305_10485 [Candidatus Jettenia sp. AMX2]
MTVKETYEKKLQAQLDEWEAEINKLKDKADKAAAEAQPEYNKLIDELRSMQEAAKKKIAELKAAGDNAWEHLEEGIENIFNSLGKALDSMNSRFQ